MGEPNEGMRKHKLMPKELKAKIPKLYSQDGVKDKMVYAKYFSPKKFKSLKLGTD